MRISSIEISKSFFLLLLIALASVSATSATRNVSAAKSTMTFSYLLGTGPFCELEETACPDIAMAPNGDTISIAGSGTLSVFPKSVTGGGTFTHKHADGSVAANGTWTATQLVEFLSYGDATPQGLPASFFGGKATIMVNIFVGSTLVHTAILTVHCLLGNPPMGAHEGIRLNVQDAVNYNQEVSGDTLFLTS